MVFLFCPIQLVLSTISFYFLLLCGLRSLWLSWFYPIPHEHLGISNTALSLGLVKPWNCLLSELNLTENSGLPCGRGWHSSGCVPHHSGALTSFTKTQWLSLEAKLVSTACREKKKANMNTSKLVAGRNTGWLLRWDFINIVVEEIFPHKTCHPPGPALAALATSIIWTQTSDFLLFCQALMFQPRARLEAQVPAGIVGPLSRHPYAAKLGQLTLGEGCKDKISSSPEARESRTWGKKDLWEFVYCAEWQGSSEPGIFFRSHITGPFLCLVSDGPTSTKPHELFFSTVFFSISYSTCISPLVIISLCFIVYFSLPPSWDHHVYFSSNCILETYPVSNTI